jgi:hypothetical protein
LRMRSQSVNVARVPGGDLTLLDFNGLLWPVREDAAAADLREQRVGGAGDVYTR